MLTEYILPDRIKKGKEQWCNHKLLSVLEYSSIRFLGSFF